MRFFFFFGAENKEGLARKPKYKKDNNCLEGIILQQWNLITSTRILFPAIMILPYLT